MAVVFAGITSYKLETYRSKRDTLTKLSEQIRNDLDAIQEHVTDYYQRAQNTETDAAIETKIIMLDREISSSVRMYSNHLKNLKGLKNLDHFLDEFSLGVMSLRSFQADNRQIDLISQRISLDVISRLRAAITQSRLERVTWID